MQDNEMYTENIFCPDRASGKNVPSLIRIVPVLIVSAIWDLLGVYSDPFFRSSWRRQLDVCVRFEL